MSEVKNIEHVTSLEDLFLSREFGKPLARPVALPFQDDTLFGGTPPRSPLVPLVAVPTAGHGSVTHQRQIQSRNRVIATVSGVAAAVLIGVGLVSAIGKPGTSPTTTASGSLGSGPTGGTNIGDGNPVQSPPTNQPPPTPSGSGGSGVNLASAVVGTSPGVSTKPITIKVYPSPPGGGGQPTIVTVTPPPAGSSGSVLSPVLVLVGHLVITVGATTTTAATGLTGTLPVLQPVTSGVVGSLGNTLSGLGLGLIRSA